MSAAPADVATPTSVVPGADIPWVEIGAGVEMKLLRRGADDDVYTMLNRFAPGFEAPKHLHLGEVHGWTIQGRWHYHEYDWYACAGDYIYEPPNSVHTLHVPEDNSEPTVALFVIHQGMELYDADGNVFMTQDGAGMEAIYRAVLETKGIPYPAATLP